MHPDTRTDGFIALTSVIIISAIVMGLVFALSESGFFIRGEVLSAELKAESMALAESCADIARLKLTAEGDNPGYLGGETVAIGAGSCEIFPIAIDGSGNKIIKTQAKPHNIYTNLKVIIDPATFALFDWEEVPHF